MLCRLFSVFCIFLAHVACAQESSIQALGSGTGFFVSSGCHFVTNLHVVKGADLLAVVGSNGEELQARLVAFDESNDLALLKAITTEKCVPLSVAKSDDVVKGASAHTLGFPRPSKQGRESKFTTGIVSSLSGLQGSPTTFQISTPVQPGNSGGALLNDAGQVIGVIVSKLRATNNDVPEGVNYAVKSNILVELLRSAQNQGMERFSSVSPSKRNLKLPEIATKAEVSTVMVLAGYKGRSSASNVVSKAESEKRYREVDGIRWSSPSNAKVISGYTPERRGIEYLGSPGSVVSSVAKGKVVYAGEGLRGYGKLVLIKHDGVYMTAYGHNQTLFVKEGDDVQAGQPIAEMGTLLQFEIRKYGKDVDPAGFIPI